MGKEPLWPKRRGSCWCTQVSWPLPHLYLPSVSPQYLKVIIGSICSSLTIFFFSQYALLSVLQSGLFLLAHISVHWFLFFSVQSAKRSFSDGSLLKEPTCQCRRHGLIPGSGQEDALEVDVPTHTSVFVWEIAWAEEPGRLQSTQSQRIGRDLMTEQQQ